MVRLIVTACPVGSTVTCSIMQTQSAPSGTGAPVMIRIASPALSRDEVPSPAKIEPITFSRVEPAEASCARRANPSIDELVKPGTASFAVNSSATTQPRASASARVSGVSGVNEPRTKPCASRNVIMRASCTIQLEPSRTHSQVADADDVARFLAPNRSALPDFALPHRHRRLHRVNTELGRLEGLLTVRRRNGDHHCRATEVDPTDPVMHGDGPQFGPAGTRHADDVRDTTLGEILAGFVLE